VRSRPIKRGVSICSRTPWSPGTRSTWQRRLSSSARKAIQYGTKTSPTFPLRALNILIRTGNIPVRSPPLLAPTSVYIRYEHRHEQLSDGFFTVTVPFTNKPRLSFEVVLPLWRHKGPHPQPVSPLSPPLSSAQSYSTSSLHARAQRAERGQHTCEQKQLPAPQRPPVRRGRNRKQPSTII
jgi:hypothetical protein